MGNLCLLVKIDFINLLKINNLKSNKSNDNKKMIAFAIICTIILGFIGYFIYNISSGIITLLIEYNNPNFRPEIVLLGGFFLSILITLFTSIYKAPSYLFHLRDFDILTSLPIKDSTILVSKIVGMLYTNYFFSFFIMVIPAIAYHVQLGDYPLFGLVLFLLFLTTPLLPITISTIISYVLGGISSKIKYKNLILIFGSMVLLIGYMVLMIKIQSSSTYFIENGSSIIRIIETMYPPNYYFVDALKNCNIISLIIFSLYSLVPFAIFILIFSKGFRKINSRMKGIGSASTYSVEKIKSSSPIKALVNREFRRYFGTYSYIVNTSFSLVMLVVASAALILFGVDKVGDFLDVEIIMNIIQLQTLFFILLILLLTCTTYCSISLEGENLWILKSNPIEEKDIFKSKIYMNTILNTPITVFSFILLAVYFKFDLVFSIISVVGIIAFTFLVAIIGLVANLMFPNLNWKNEVAVVKRSASMFVTWIAIAIYLGSFFIVGSFTNFNNVDLFILLAVLITVFIDLVIWKWLKVKGSEIFRSL